MGYSVVIYQGKINKIEVPVDQDIVGEASRWLEERIGPSALMARPLKDLMNEDPSYDPTCLFTSDYLWDAYVDPGSFKAYFQIKGHDDLAMLFKLTFGGSSA